MILIEIERDSRNFEHLAQNFPPKSNYPPSLRKEQLKERKMSFLKKTYNYYYMNF